MKGSHHRSVREQLRNILAESRYARANYTPLEVREVAAKLGVTEAFLLEARQFAKKPKIFRQTFATLSFNIPPTLWPVIDVEVLRFRTTRKGLCRSIIYRYLTERWEPPMSDTWVYKGERHITKSGQNHWPAPVSEAARTVFLQRAEKLGATYSKIFRSLLVGFLSGEFYQDLTIVTRAKFSNKESDYFSG